MKKLYTVLLIFFLMSGINAQPWFDIGIKGGIGSSFMYNKQIFDDQYLTHVFKPGYTFGGKFGFNFVQEHQLTVDVMKTSYTQGFHYYPEAGVEKYREFSIQGMEYLLMYRLNRNGTYFEVGPQLTTVSKVTYKDEVSDFIAPDKPGDVINKSFYSIALGFGGYIFGTDNFGVSTGLRFNYTLNDIASDKGREKNFPVLIQGDSDPTRNLGVMFIIEMNYDFGYLVSPSCGKRGKLFVF